MPCTPQQVSRQINSGWFRRLQSNAARADMWRTSTISQNAEACPAHVQGITLNSAVLDLARGGTGDRQPPQALNNVGICKSYVRLPPSAAVEAASDCEDCSSRDGCSSSAEADGSTMSRALISLACGFRWDSRRGDNVNLNSSEALASMFCEAAARTSNMRALIMCAYPWRTKISNTHADVPPKLCAPLWRRVCAHQPSYRLEYTSATQTNQQHTQHR